MLARGLRDNRTLVTLDLRWNEIGNPGALAFKDLFVTGTNAVLKSVKLVGNKVRALQDELRLLPRLKRQLTEQCL